LATKEGSVPSARKPGQSTPESEAEKLNVQINELVNKVLGQGKKLVHLA
jgi:hypothetical protein